MTINSFTLLSLLLVSYLSAKLITDKDWGKNNED